MRNKIRFFILVEDFYLQLPRTGAYRREYQHFGQWVQTLVDLQGQIGFLDFHSVQHYDFNTKSFQNNFSSAKYDWWCPFSLSRLYNIHAEDFVDFFFL